MPRTENFGTSPRKDLPIFYVLDTSGSMTGAKISALNHGMEETMAALKTIAKSNGDARLKAAVMEFNTGCRWITVNGPEDLEEDFEYEYLEAGGLTEVGCALTELGEKLSTHAFLNSSMGSLMPIIIFMTDGQATDNYESALAQIRKNRWFRRAVKIGIALGDDADLSMIASVVGNSEAVIRVNDLELFRKLMKFVSVTSSMLVSTSSTPDTAQNGSDVVKQALEETGDPDAAAVQLDDSQYSKEEELPADDDDGDEEW